MIDNKAQMMVLETIFFTATVILSLVFLYQLSPPSIVTNVYTEDLKILGTEALYAIYNSVLDDVIAEGYPPEYPSSKLVHYLIQDGYGSMISDLRNLLPSTVMYHIYISNGDDIMFWCDSIGNTAEDDILPSVDPVTVSNCIVAIDPVFLDVYESDFYNEDANPGLPFYNYDESTYEVRLKMWYI